MAIFPNHVINNWANNLWRNNSYLRKKPKKRPFQPISAHSEQFHSTVNFPINCSQHVPINYRQILNWPFRTQTIGMKSKNRVGVEIWNNVSIKWKTWQVRWHLGKINSSGRRPLVISGKIRWNFIYVQCLFFNREMNIQDRGFWKPGNQSI